MKKSEMKPADVTALCSAATEAFQKLSKRARLARFTWKGTAYKASYTNLRLIVETTKGEQVACRWGG